MIPTSWAQDVNGTFIRCSKTSRTSFESLIYHQFTPCAQEAHSLNEFSKLDLFCKWIFNNFKKANEKKTLLNVLSWNYNIRIFNRFYKSIFLHVIPVRIIVPWCNISAAEAWKFLVSFCVEEWWSERLHCHMYFPHKNHFLY